MKKEIRISYRSFFAVCTGFLGLPVLLFLACYLKPYIGIPLALIILCALFFAVKDACKGRDLKPLDGKKTDITIPMGYFIGYLIFALFLSWFSGVGEYIVTFNDHHYRFAILNDLVSYKWPVIYDYSTQTNPQVIEYFSKTPGSNAAFVYYFTYWMPAALTGKVFGLTAARIALIIWNGLGIFLTLIGVSKYIGRASFTVPFCYFCFGGLDVIPNIIHDIIPYAEWNGMERWAPELAYMSNFAELTSVFHQCVPVFLAVTLIMISKNTRSVGLIGALILSYTPWGIIGLVPVALVSALRKEMREGGTGQLLKNLFTFQNIVSCIVLLFVFGALYMSNSASVSDKGFIFKYITNPALCILIYIAFIAVEVLPFALLLYKNEKKNALFLAAVIELCLIPLFKASFENDFCMRVSMAPRFILCILFARFLKDIYDADKIISSKKLKRKKKDIIKMVLTVLVAIGMVYPAFNLSFYIAGCTATGEPIAADGVVSFGNIRDEEHLWNCTHNYMSEGYEDTFFFKYLVK